MSAQPVAASTPNSAAPAPTEPHFSPGSIEVLKLSDAKLSNEVIEAYIRNSSTAFNPTASEIIALRRHGVSDSVITTMLNHGGELRAQQAAQFQAVAQAQAQARAQVPVYVTQVPGANQTVVTAQAPVYAPGYAVAAETPVYADSYYSYPTSYYPSGYYNGYNAYYPYYGGYGYWGGSSCFSIGFGWPYYGGCYGGYYGWGNSCYSGKYCNNWNNNNCWNGNSWKGGTWNGNSSAWHGNTTGAHGNPVAWNGSGPAAYRGGSSASFSGGSHGSSMGRVSTGSSSFSSARGASFHGGGGGGGGRSMGRGR